jgi:hypothetical protein
MATYLYECGQHGEFEYEHSIKDILDVCPKCLAENNPAPCKVKRLIAGGTSFVLAGGGWAKQGYS